MLEAVQRANIVYSETLGPEQFGIIQKPLTLAEKIYNQTWLRKVFIIVVLAAAWQLYGALARQPAAGADRSPTPCARWSRTWPMAPFQAGR